MQGRHFRLTDVSATPVKHLLTEQSCHQGMACENPVQSPLCSSSNLVRRGHFMTLHGARSLTRMCVLVALAFTAGASAQQEEHQFQRLVGRVVDENGKAVRGADVKLKDLHTLLIRSYITQDSGQFHFSGLNSATGYEVWARLGSRRSDVQYISRFEEGKEINVELKLNGD
jgi:hypothetical protein